MAGIRILSSSAESISHEWANNQDEMYMHGQTFPSILETILASAFDIVKMVQKADTA